MSEVLTAREGETKDAQGRRRVHLAYVPHPMAERGLEKARMMLRHLELTGKALGMRLAGPPSSGKSTSVKTLCSEPPPMRVDGILKSRVLYVMVREQASLGTLFEDLLGALGDPLCAMGAAGEKRARVKKLLELAEVAMVILDEPHHFTDERAKSIWLAAMQFSKFLFEWRICVLLVGVKALDDQVTISDEVSRRFRVAHYLDDYPVKKASQIAVVRDYCGRVGQSLQGIPVLDLGTTDWCLRFIAASGGRAGVIAEIVESAAFIAVSREATCVGQEHFVEAWDELFADSKESNLRHLQVQDKPLRNPFSMSDEEIRVVVSGFLKPHTSKPS